jgi:hypothetical protein
MHGWCMPPREDATWSSASFRIGVPDHQDPSGRYSPVVNSRIARAWREGSTSIMQNWKGCATYVKHFAS